MAAESDGLMEQQHLSLRDLTSKSFNPQEFTWVEQEFDLYFHVYIPNPADADESANRAILENQVRSPGKGEGMGSPSSRATYALTAMVCQARALLF